jgi:hypothetical protein
MVLLATFVLVVVLLCVSVYKVPTLEKQIQIQELVEKWEEKQEGEEDMAPILREAARQHERTRLMSSKAMWKAIMIVSAFCLPPLVMLSFIFLR